MALESQSTFADSARCWLCQCNFTFSSMTVLHSADLPWRSLVWSFTFVSYFFQNRIIILIEKQRLRWAWKTQEFAGPQFWPVAFPLTLYTWQKLNQVNAKVDSRRIYFVINERILRLYMHDDEKDTTVIKIVNFYRSQMMSSPITQ